MWRTIEKWGKSHPVILAFIAFSAGALPGGPVAYNFGVYEGTTTSDRVWRSSFAAKVKEAVNEQIASQCGEVVSGVHNTCQHSIRTYQRSIRDLEGNVRARD